MKLLALLSLALLATALVVDAKTEKDVTSLQIGVKVGAFLCPGASHLQLMITANLRDIPQSDQGGFPK